MIEISFYRADSMSVAADGGHLEQQLWIQKNNLYLLISAFVLINWIFR
jgi:hypothetical protein